MAAAVVYQNTALVGTTKAGILKPDANGYYELVLGAFDYFNSADAYYTLEPFKLLLMSSSTLMRRVNRGALRSECGHPRFHSGMSRRDIILRLLDIHEDRTCAHIKSIALDEERVGKDGRKVAAVIGMVKPSGPMGDFLATQLENPDENVCFSIRSLTHDTRNSAGTLIKAVKEIVTWDYVNEPGIDVATKYHSPSLESISFDTEDLRAAESKALEYGVGMESAQEILTHLIKNNVSPLEARKMLRGSRPKSAGWN